MVADVGYTSLVSIGSHRRITEVEDENDEHSSNMAEVRRKLQEKQSLLLRLFESPHFDINLALKYLFISKETGILSYLGEYSDSHSTSQISEASSNFHSFLGNKLFSFPPDVVDFYLPQLITMYINMPNVAQALHCYILKRFAFILLLLNLDYIYKSNLYHFRCSQNVTFALECFWLLEAYGVEQFRKQSTKVQGFNLRQKIIQDYLSDSPSRPTSRSSFHSRSQSDAKVAVGPTATASPVTMPRSDSAASVRSIQGAPGDLKTGKAFDDGCRCMASVSPDNEHQFECLCSSNSKIRPEMEFIKALMNIGNKLKFIPLKADKSQQLVYELFMLNLNLPARVYVPLFTNTIEHFVVRIPHTSGCVLNSKDKAPYCIYVEVVEVKNFCKTKLPTKLPEGDAEVSLPPPSRHHLISLLFHRFTNIYFHFQFHRRMRSNSITTPLPGLNVRPSSNVTLDSFTGNAVFETQISQELETNSLNDGEDEKFTQFDKLFVDDTYLESSSQISADSEDIKPSPSLPATLNPAEIRQRLSELKKKKRKKMEHCPEDPSASAMRLVFSTLLYF